MITGPDNLFALPEPTALLRGELARVPALAAALSRLVTDPTLRQRLSDGARARAADFGIAEWHDRLSALWTSLARR